MTELSVIEGGAHESALPATRQVDLLAVARQAEAARELGKTLIASGFLPDAIRKPEQAVLIVLKGQELGLPPLYALSHLVVIQGKPAMSAEVMRALVHRAGHKIRIIETTRERAVVEGVRRDDPNHPIRISFDEEDAKRAGLAGKGGHKTYPAALKLARATSALCRAAFADAIGGVSYVPEELGATVDEDGQILDARPHVEEAVAVEETNDLPSASSTGNSGRSEEHEQTLADLADAMRSIRPDQRPDKRTVWDYAFESLPNARKALDRLLKLADKHPHGNAPGGDEDIEEADVVDEDAGGNEELPDFEAMRGAARDATPGPQKARKAQIELLETIAGELAENGVEKLVERVGKPLSELTVEEADDWLQRLDPDGVEGE